MNAIVGDIQSYTVFANIDNRKGAVEGFQVILTKEQLEAIEDIVLSSKPTVKMLDEAFYTLGDSDEH